MTSRIQNFLKSGLLEKYVQGETTKQESHKVDDFINQHPEIKEKYPGIKKVENVPEFSSNIAEKISIDKLKELFN